VCHGDGTFLAQVHRDRHSTRLKSSCLSCRQDDMWWGTPGTVPLALPGRPNNRIIALLTGAPAATNVYYIRANRPGGLPYVRGGLYVFAQSDNHT